MKYFFLFFALFSSSCAGDITAVFGWSGGTYTMSLPGGVDGDNFQYVNTGGQDAHLVSLTDQDGTVYPQGFVFSTSPETGYSLTTESTFRTDGFTHYVNDPNYVILTLSLWPPTVHATDISEFVGLINTVTPPPTFWQTALSLLSSCITTSGVIAGSLVGLIAGVLIWKKIRGFDARAMR